MPQTDPGTGWLSTMLIVQVLILLSVIGYTFLHRRQQRMVRQEGMCRSCGYDLRATPDRCPECGTLASSNQSGSARR